MEVKRRDEIRQLVEACQHTDTTELESEKTAVIAELLVEVERLVNSDISDEWSLLDAAMRYEDEDRFEDEERF